MSLVAVASLHGSPGATSLACALAGRVAADGARALLVEADPDGGVLAPRFGLRLQPCLTDLAGSARTGLGAEAVWEFTQPLGRDLHALVAHPGADQTAAALRSCGHHLAQALAGVEVPTVVDVGRLRPGSPALPVVERASRVLLMVRPDLVQVMTVLHGLTAQVDLANVQLVTVGTKPYSARQVAEVTGRRLAGTVPDDAGAVQADPFTWTGRRRTGWVRAVDGIVAGAGLTGVPEGAAPPPGDAAPADHDVDQPGPAASASASRS